MKLSALLEFSSAGDLKDIFIYAGSNEQERFIKEALAKLIKPSLLDRILRLLTK